MAHEYNPSYSGGRDQEDRGSKPARTNLKKNPSKIAGGLVEWLKV
jgi:hypothetical protein